MVSHHFANRVCKGIANSAQYNLYIIHNMNWIFYTRTTQAIVLYVKNNSTIMIPNFKCLIISWGFPEGSAGKESSCDAGDTRDLGSIPGSGKFPGGRNDSPQQYCCLENPIDGGVCPAKIPKVLKIWTWLSN